MRVRKSIRTSGSVAVLISAGLFCLAPNYFAQSQASAPELDYFSLAITSISISAVEASKLPNIPQRVSLLIRVAKILPASQRDEAIRLLDVALGDLKEWGSKDKASWYQRHTATELRNEVLAVYAKLDPEKATAQLKEFQAAAESTTTDKGTTSGKDGNWFTQFSDRRTNADQAARVALSLVDSDPDKASAFIFKSLQGGTVSGVLLEIVQKLIQNGNRAFLNKLEMGTGEIL